MRDSKFHSPNRAWTIPWQELYSFQIPLIEDKLISEMCYIIYVMTSSRIKDLNQKIYRHLDNSEMFSELDWFIDRNWSHEIHFLTDWMRGKAGVLGYINHAFLPLISSFMNSIATVTPHLQLCWFHTYIAITEMHAYACELSATHKF